MICWWSGRRTRASTNCRTCRTPSRRSTLPPIRPSARNTAASRATSARSDAARRAVGAELLLECVGRQVLDRDGMQEGETAQLSTPRPRSGRRADPSFREQRRSRRRRDEAQTGGHGEHRGEDDDAIDREPHGVPMAHGRRPRRTRTRTYVCSSTPFRALLSSASPRPTAARPVRAGAPLGSMPPCSTPSTPPTPATPGRRWRSCAPKVPLATLASGLRYVTRYAEARAVLRDTETFSNASGMKAPGVEVPLEDRLLGELDPPRHTAVRRVMVTAMTPEGRARGRTVHRGDRGGVARRARRRPLRSRHVVHGGVAEPGHRCTCSASTPTMPISSRAGPRSLMESTFPALNRDRARRRIRGRVPRVRGLHRRTHRGTVGAARGRRGRATTCSRA